MNWFERYGIVGATYLLFSSVWLVLAFQGRIGTDNIAGISFKLIGAFYTLSLIPIGYIISTISMLLYYKVFFWNHVHKEVLTELIKKERKYITEKVDLIDYEKKPTEVIAEVILAYIATDKDRDMHEKLRLFNTKRFDVLAINNAIFVSFLASLITGGAIMLYRSHRSHIVIVVGISVAFAIILFLLRCNSLVIEDQIKQTITLNLLKSNRNGA